ncbi:MAG: ParB N-terminal domain-containing protein [Lachnospiraceae bacterium]
MAGKKGSVNNAAFLKQVSANAQAATKDVSKTMEKISLGEIAEKGKKKIAHIDINKMVDAPEEWNKYPRLKDTQADKYLELKMSIYEKGIEEPLILWERPEGEYMILAGHNRHDISCEIIQECREEPGFDEDKYRYPACIVYAADELNEEQARGVIDDTNLYRDFSKLPEKVKIEIIKSRMDVYQRRRYSKGERIDQLAKELGIKKTSIYENLSISENVYEPLRELYYDGKLKRKAILKFTNFDGVTQQWIYDNFKDQITEAKVNALKKNMNRDAIANVFNAEAQGVKKLTVEIPADRVDEFREMFDKWLLKAGK